VKGEQLCKANDVHSKERTRSSWHFPALCLKHFDSECEVKDCELLPMRGATAAKLDIITIHACYQSDSSKAVRGGFRHKRKKV
jgi:hypothetical protein